MKIRLLGVLLRSAVAALRTRRHLVLENLALRQRPPSQSWRVFLENHFRDLVSIDFFTVSSATFQILLVIVVLAYDRRRVLHLNVTEHPNRRIHCSDPGTGQSEGFHRRIGAQSGA